LANGDASFLAFAILPELIYTRESASAPYGLRAIGTGIAFTQKLALIQDPQAQSLAHLIAHLPKCPKLRFLITIHRDWSG
jgi:hypothetical protein